MPALIIWMTERSLSAHECVADISRRVWGLKRTVGSLFKEGFLNALITYEKQEFINFIIRINPPRSDVTLMSVQNHCGKRREITRRFLKAQCVRSTGT